MKAVSVKEMMAVEREADAQGWTYAQMMIAAGQGLAKIIHERYRSSGKRQVVILAGPGNNGGDALVAAAWLAGEGWNTRVWQIGERRFEGEPLVEAQRQGVELAWIRNDKDSLYDLLGSLQEAEVLVDGLLGTGTRLPLRGILAEVLQQVKDALPARLPVVAVDCPSGVDCDSGEVAPQSLAADLTVCMQAVKLGLLKFPAFPFAGEILTVPIGLPEGNRAWDAINARVMDVTAVRAELPVRKPDGHKGTFGTARIVAGCQEFPGAALLSAKGALLSGAGMVSLAVTQPVQWIVGGQIPEAIWMILPDTDGALNAQAAQLLAEEDQRYQALLVGPGMGQYPHSQSFIRDFLAWQRGLSADQKLPLVVDADGLKNLVQVKEWFRVLAGRTVLTPHPGEMSVLCGLPVDEIQRNRAEIATKYAGEWGVVVVLKGAVTLVASPDGDLTYIPIATSALAHAGTGDVLAGLICGLLAQGIDPYAAACAAAWIHARAGGLAAEHLGQPDSVSAGLVADCIPRVLAELRKPV